MTLQQVKTSFEQRPVGYSPLLQGIMRLEAEMQHLRNLLNNTTALATSLKELAGAPAKAAG